MTQELKSFFDQLCDISEKNILKYFNSSYEIVLKSDLSPVTIADQSTEEILRKEIERHFPDHAILGEEFGESGNPSSQYKWILDPIDGTKSFINHIPLFGTLSALLKKATNLNESVLLTTCIKDSQSILGPNFLKLASKVKYARTWGDCYGHLMVAAGRSEIMVDPILSLWDIAALKPCVEGAGGAFFDLSGDSSGLGTQAISCSPELKDEILQILRS